MDKGTERIMNMWHRRIEFFRRKNQYGKALETADQAIKDMPSFAVFRLAKGNILCMLERYDEAVGEFEMAVIMFPTWGSVMTLASAYYLAGRHDDSLAVLDEVAEFPDRCKRENQIEYLYSRSRALLCLRRYSSVLTECDEAIRLCDEEFNELGLVPRYAAQIFLFRARAFRLLSRHAEALEDVDKAISIVQNPADNEPLNTMLLSELIDFRKEVVNELNKYLDGQIKPLPDETIQ